MATQPSVRHWPVLTLPQAVSGAAAVRPDAVAIIDPHRTATCAQFLAECHAMRALLVARGVRRLGIAVGNEAGHLAALVACASLGIPAVPVAIDWTAPDIARRFAVAGVDLALVAQDDQERLGPALEIPLLAASRENAEVPPDLAPLPPGDFADTHMIAPSGGTSGRLKFAHLTHANTVSRFYTQLVEFDFVPGGRFLCATPLFHGGGRSFSLCHLYFGGSVLLRPHFDLAQWFADMRDCSSTFVVPTMASRIVADARERLADDRCVIISGARVERDLARTWQDRLGGAGFNYYGSVEAGAIAVCRLAQMVDAQDPRSLGHAAFGVDLEFQPAQMVEGEAWSQIVVRGPSVAIGVETEDEGYRPIDGMNPGDLVRRDADGELSFGGRADDVIITGGVNVYPGLVEHVFQRLEGLAEIALVGVPSAEWGHELVLAIEGDPGAIPTEDALRAFATAELPRYSRPKRYRIVARFPQTAAGKVDRRALVRMIMAETGAA